MKLIDIITGTRPNFMKVAPIIRCLQQALNHGGQIAYRLVHTGQHTDPAMRDIFLAELGIPLPDIDLAVGYRDTATGQMVAIMVAYEALLRQQQQPDLVIVVGDCTSTLACALAVKNVSKQIRLAHVEAGIRSGDMSMPEELNRIITDAVADYFFTTTTTAGLNLQRSGIGSDRIFFVGNTMIDTLLYQLPYLTRPALADELGLERGHFLLLTLHRRANILDPGLLSDLIHQVMKGAGSLPVIFPLHPHTAQKLDRRILDYDNLHITAPMGYCDFVYLLRDAKAVITDSGGITEEATVLNVPCLTLRAHTERPETCSLGSNELVGADPGRIQDAFSRLFRGDWKTARIPERWDGAAAQRIVAHIIDTCLALPVPEAGASSKRITP